MRKKKFIAFIIILCAFVFFYLQYQVIANNSGYTPVISDYIIILGHSLNNENEPSEWLNSRLEYGLALYNAGYGDKIIVTGGQPGSYKKSVASAMSEWLVSQNVPTENIILEENARNTDENFKYSKELTGGGKSILVVTNDFHMYRSMLIARDYYDEVSGSEAGVPFSFEKFLAYLKEPLSIIKYAVLSIFL